LTSETSRIASTELRPGTHLLRTARNWRMSV
jgi:hypothetical protein